MIMQVHGIGSRNSVRFPVLVELNWFWNSLWRRYLKNITSCFVILSLFIEKQTISIYCCCNLTPLICFYNNTWRSNFTWAVDISLPNLRLILLKVILSVIIVFDLIYNKLPICLFRRILFKKLRLFISLIESVSFQVIIEGFTCFQFFNNLRLSGSKSNFCSIYLLVIFQ